MSDDIKEAYERYKGKQGEDKQRRKAVVDATIQRVLRKAQVLLQREVKKKLTYEYLGIRTSMGKQTTNAILKNKVLYFGTNPKYMIAYETGKWGEYKMSRAEKKRYRKALKTSNVSQIRATWKGKRSKRPFLLDTIKDKEINRVLIAELKRANI